MGRVVYWCACGVVSGIVRSVCRVTITWLGGRRLKGPLVIVTNHVSRFDMIVVSACLPLRVHLVMARDVIRGHPIMSAVLCAVGRSVGAIVVPRWGSPSPTAVRRAVELLRDGGTIMIAPEGTRNRSDRILPARGGAAYLARHSNAAILPIVTTGYRRGRLGRIAIAITIGSQFRLGELDGPPTREQIRLDSEAITAKLQLLVDLANGRK